MLDRTIRPSLFALAIAMISIPAAAQTLVDHTTASCGTDAMSRTADAALLERTREANPELYRRLVGHRGESRLQRSADGLEFTFLVQRGAQFVEVTAELLFDGQFARVWVDLADTGRSSVKNAIPRLARALDTAVQGTATNIAPRDPQKGILQNDIEVFGDVPPDPEWDDKTNFLLTDLDAGILGYFSSRDQTELNGSNRMNLLYIDSREGLGNLTLLLSTIAHEFQHLIQYARYPSTGDDSHRFFNEGLSENANLINGYYDRQNQAYLANTNVEFFTLRGDNPALLDADYQRAMTFVHYLREQFGERFIYEFAGTRGNGFDRVTATLQALGYQIDAYDVMRAYAVANLLQIDANPAYNYRLRLSTSPSAQSNPRRATPHFTYTGTTFPTTNNIVLQPGGTAYAQFTSPGGLRVRFTGPTETRFMMVASRRGANEVVELRAGTDYTLPLWEGGAYDRVTFAAINLAGGIREVQWNITPVTSDVADDTGERTPSGLDHVGFSSVDGMIRIGMNLDGSGPASLDVSDARGTVVARPLTSAQLPAGRRTLEIDGSQLPTGTYLVRMRQGTVSSTRLLIVTR